jgi:uncharacterized protein (TIGR02145 family)
MKKIFTFTAALLIAASVMGQAPSSFKYQAVLRDTRGNIKAKTSTSIIFSILQGSTTGTSVYSETHSITTDVYGLINLEIGKGTVITGSFSGIDWGTGTYFVKVTVDGVEMGISQLLSVPYALYAAKAGNGFSGSYSDLTNKPILFDGTWLSLTGKPSLATVATSGSYADLSDKPTITNGTVTSITGTAPISVATGTTTPVISMVQANGTTNGYLSSTDWTTFNNKSSFDGTWTSLSGKPNFSKWDKDSTDNVIITGNQTIAGNKTFTGTTTVAAPVNATDAATKAYVDSIKQEIKLEIYGEMGVTDVEGNTYKAVKIGNQVWMKENLKTTKSNDGTDIPNVTNSSTWIGLTTPGYVWYNNDISNKNIYGAIYNWHSVNTGKLCPVGWHVPTNTEWTTLVNYIGGNSIAGGKLKETGFTHWLSPNTGATNESGFTALPGSSRDNVGNWGGAIGINGLWWTADAISSNTGKRWYLSNTNSAIVNDWSYKVDGLSVRCIKDGSTGVTIPAVSSSTITNITSTTATVGGNVTSDGNGTRSLLEYITKS